jgi:hypothetical protein
MTDAKNQLKIASLEAQIALYKKNLENAAERYSIIRKKKRALKKQVERLTWIMRAALPPSRLDVLLQQPVDFGYKKQPERSVAEFPRTWEIERKSAIETPPVQEMSDVSESEEESIDEEQIKRERELDIMFVERPSTTELVAHYFQGKSSVSLISEQQAIVDADGTKLHNAMEVAMQWPSRELNDPVPELVSAE